VVCANSGQPLAGAVVTLRAIDVGTTTRADGVFVVQVPSTDRYVEITAWAPGYFIGGAATAVPADGVRISLRRYSGEDNPEYEWIDPTPDPQSDGACGNCHTIILPQWQGNAHGGAVSNRRFYSLYNGTDVDGTTEAAPGYRLDFPGTAGNCAACHAPGAAVDAPFTTDMNDVRDRPVAGIHCDYCHKLGGAYLERPGVGAGPRPYANMPGVFSLRSLRPPDGEQLFVGPLADVPDPDTYLPLMSESAFCAPCHQFSFWGTPIYTSYDEWLASPFADPDHGQTCQDCHMPPVGARFIVPPDRGGLIRPAHTLSSHLQRGVTDRDLMGSTLDLDVVARREGAILGVTVRVTNVGAGHHVPTDHPGRHLLLVVEAADGSGTPLRRLEGPLIPAWGGGLAGLPGTGYAKLLEDLASGEWPVVSYWKQALIREDTRLAAMESDVTRYTFGARAGGMTVTVKVVFRRLFEHLADRYGWDLGELVMAEKTITIPGDR
jgi:hypothetical protein